VDRAIADYRAAADLPATSESERKAAAAARTRLVALDPQKPRPQTIQSQPIATISSTSLGRRVALVIGNSAYQNAGRLANPANDAHAIAASFRLSGNRVDCALSAPVTKRFINSPAESSRES
jgi:hypothetical protein